MSTVEHKQSEDALRVSEARYRRLFETAKDGIFLLDAATGQITDANPFIAELLGYTQEELFGKKLWEIGFFKDVVASKVAFRELQEKKYIRYEELPLKTKQGEIVEVEFVSNLYEVSGKKVIQCNVRDISERMRTKNSLRKANEELSGLVFELQKHDQELNLINRMNDLLQACKTQDEAYQVIALAVGELFPGQNGGLAILDGSSQFLETIARWGAEPLLDDVFSTQDCWAMRRGQQHQVTDPQTNIICRHFIQPPKTGYLCLPLVVQGELLGLLNIDTPDGMDHKHAISRNQLVVSVCESIKLSLSNLKLREIMREHATIDSLTGLFNRRYLDDTLPREVIRSQRQKTQLCLAMLDIDHFKQFNDTYGHEAGDAILHELGAILQENVRKSDIACRYGGEEFVIVLLDSPLEASYQHLEKIRSLVKEMQINYGDQILGSVTLSIGLIEASKNNLSVREILRFGDDAMYSAKRAGRDCIFVYRDLANNLVRNE